jgi:predicted transcriptional regulator
LKELEVHINRINSKLQELLKKHAALAKESDQQKKIIQKLEQENELREGKINMLEQQQHILKSAAGKMEDPDKKEFEQVISKYIREIDKCINLLND